MAKRLARGGFGSVVLVTLFVQAVGVFGQSGDMQLLAPGLLRQAGLRQVWQVKLPIEKGECLEQLFILGNRLYALSDRNYMVSMNRDDGGVVFARQVAPQGLPVVGWDLFGDELYSLVGNKFVTIDPKTGRRLVERRIRLGTSCPATRNSTYFYIACGDQRVHVYRVEDRVKLFEVASPAGATITSILATENMVVFGNTAGHVVSFTPSEPKKLWSFKAGGRVVGPMVIDANSLFFAGGDTNIYRLDLLTGRLVWKCPAGGVLSQPPRVTEQVVYQKVFAHGLVAVDKAEGKLLWELPGGVELLAEAAGTAYVMTGEQKLVVMDNKKARKIYSMNMAGVDRYVCNTSDAKIYIGSADGRLACLEPID